jgi:hypothetical protein
MGVSKIITPGTIHSHNPITHIGFMITTSSRFVFPCKVHGEKLHIHPPVTAVAGIMPAPEKSTGFSHDVPVILFVKHFAVPAQQSNV